MQIFGKDTPPGQVNISRCTVKEPWAQPFRKPLCGFSRQNPQESSTEMASFPVTPSLHPKPLCLCNTSLSPDVAPPLTYQLLRKA